MIEPLVRVQSRAAVLPDANIDTDIIFPARFLLLIDRDGLKDCLFADRRFDAEGKENPGFPLNHDSVRDARILVTGPGFGCGSSREQAVWALVDYGIRVVIGTDFGDIFAGNANKNGLLLVRLDEEAHRDLAAKAEAGAMIEVDLPTRRVLIEGTEVCRFELKDSALEAFVNGWDETDIVLNTELPHVVAFEEGHRQRQPWLFA
jgi:3-isopropylmalate/(R)-2-methylmalate dehydratase small subunit